MRHTSLPVLGGDDEEVVFHERPEIVAIRNEPDLARRFMLHAAVSSETARRITPSRSARTLKLPLPFAAFTNSGRLLIAP